MLEVRDLEKQYGRGEVALRGVTFSVPRGQTVMVVGPSGAGKSTLVKCINRLVEPTRGGIRVGDTDVIGLRPRELRRLRRRVGMIFQDFALVDRLTVMENVLSGRLGYVGFWRSAWRRFPQADVDRAFELLDRLGLIDHVNKRADALSGGQRQRVGIARALMQSDQLLLVDEPTASLDPRTSRQIMRLITELAAERGLTSLINIHDVPLARHFGQRVIGMREGRIVFDGEPRALRADTLTTIYGEEDWQSHDGHEAPPAPANPADEADILSS